MTRPDREDDMARSSFNADALRDSVRSLHEVATKLDEGAQKLEQLGNDIAARDPMEAIRKDGFDRMMLEAARYLDERNEDIDKIADALNRTSIVVEEYDTKVMNLIKGDSQG